MGDMYSPEHYESKYHGGFQKLDRLNKILVLCLEASTLDDVNMWYKQLMNLYRELVPKLRKTKKDLAAKYDKMAEDIGSYYREYTKQTTQRDVTQRLHPRTGIPGVSKRDILHKLHEWELDLRIELERQGMDMPGTDDPRFAMLG